MDTEKGGETATVKKRVLDFANKINRSKSGSKRAVLPEHPEYKLFEKVVTDDMAEVGMHLEFRNPQSAAEIAQKCGKSPEETAKLLWDLAYAGASCMNEIDGVDKYWLEIWVPGHMEAVVNGPDFTKKYPQIGAAFDNYGRRRAPLAVGNFPIGTGPMRVVPIERAIDGETRRASYEEISHYLEQADRFSVSNCSCRTAREATGEGCGHLKEDMCIQLDWAAEYYIRTDRAREITREEAYEIIRRAEDNGLMHQVPNVEGPGKTHAICNCCSCSCLALRNANMWGNYDFIRSNYISEVDTDKCVACGECVEVCPTNALKLGQKLCTTTPIPKVVKELPYNTEWTEDKWNPDYRTNKKVVVETGSSPCKAECPAHIGIQGYIKLAAQGRYTEALELIKKENPFPAVCGRICPRKCESECTRGDIDDPVAIDDIKKFIAQKDLDADVRYIPAKRHEYGNKIAVVGAGPAGLSCAYYLALDGYAVTVFEKEKVLGGMLTMGIPSFRLEKDVLNAEIDILKEMGVEFVTGMEIGKTKSLEQLRAEGYEAFYLAIGAQAGRGLGLEGEEAAGVFTGVDFLRRVALEQEKVKLSGPTVVIGGGNVAIDVARSAVRTGSDSVSMYCLESRQEMPALEEEIEEALSEEITINNSWGPQEILTEKGKVTGIRFKKCLSVFDEEGRFAPRFDESQVITVEASQIILSIGQAIDWGGLLEGTTLELNRNNTAKADETTFQTAQSDIFVGGDAHTGPRFAIDAIAQGKEAAISIHRYVHPGQSLVLGRLKRDYRAFDKGSLVLEGYDRMPRQRTDHVPGTETKKTFSDLRGILTEEQIQKETERCLSCGAVVADPDMCVGCGACTTRCKFEAITLTRKYDGVGVDYPELKPLVIKHLLKRKLRIALTKPFKALKKVFTKN